MALGTVACPVCRQAFPHNRLDPVHAHAEALKQEVEDLKHDLRRCMDRELEALNP